MLLSYISTPFCVTIPHEEGQLLRLIVAGAVMHFRDIRKTRHRRLQYGIFCLLPSHSLTQISFDIIMTFLARDLSEKIRGSWLNGSSIERVREGTQNLLQTAFWYTPSTPFPSIPACPTLYNLIFIAF